MHFFKMYIDNLTLRKTLPYLQAKNQEEKRLWLHYLKRMIVENHPASLPQKVMELFICQTINLSIRDNIRSNLAG